MFSYVRATSICFPLNGEGTTPGSIAPERVPILEVGRMAADLDTLAGGAAVQRSRAKDNRNFSAFTLVSADTSPRYHRPAVKGASSSRRTL